ncbi:MAG: SEC-C metal-binding domain-containing protein [bacterium]
MPPGRNDPCPCGSGKKYKHCCAKHDAEASPLLRVVAKGTRSELDAVADKAIRTSVVWEADVTPMPVATEEEPTGRHAAVIIAANGAVLLVEAESHPPSDAPGVAKLLAKAIDTLLARGGAAPAEVLVRHEAVATALGLLMEGTTVDHAPVLPLVDEFAASFRQQVSGLPLPPISHPQTWAAWQLPAETLDHIFSAAATYYGAAPWQDLSDETPVELAMSNGAVWHAVVLGFAEEEYGLVLYASIDDYSSLVSAPTPEIGFSETQQPVISLFFDARAELPKPMRKEFTDAKWKVAGPKAYPSIWVLNTIGGGLSVEYANDLAMALEVLARFRTLSLDDEQLLEQLSDSWTDEITGTIARLGDDDGNYLWDVPELLTTSLAEGARADATAHSGTDEDGEEDAAIVDRFAAAMKASSANAERTKRDEQDVDFFVQLMHGVQGVRLPALSELDLRTFLYDLLPRKAMTTKEHGNAIRGSLERFFDYLAANEQLEYAWAAPILSDADSFEERWDSFPGRQENDALADWMGELFADFDARVMLPSNELAGLGEWGEMQGIAEASLYSLLQREWLIWRDAEIARGTRAPKELWDRLTERQAEWEQAPNARLGGRSPSEEIATERGARKRAKPRPPRRR